MASLTTSSTTPTSFNVAPLTTTFTPPPPCFSQLTSYYWKISTSVYPVSAWYSGGPDPGVRTDSCYPSSFATIDYFSPGICPQGYTSGCVSTSSFSSITETHAICCPSSWFCATDTTT